MAHFHVFVGPDASPAYPMVRKIGVADLRDALAKGIADFMAMPSHLVFLGLIYPIVGVAIARATSDQNALPMLYPLMFGFAMIGPFAAIGLYEMSRRRELGLDISWSHAFEVRHSPSVPSILMLGLALMVIFLIWLTTARLLYQALFGPAAPHSYVNFLHEVFVTPKGWALIILGNALGLIYAAVSLSISVVSFPLLLDRDVGVTAAVYTSIAAVRKNPGPMALWGLIIIISVAIGFSLLFVGLAVVMPVLAHASWHLYRRTVQNVVHS
ncbi:DUF2189 domain-containing protein [Methylocapsa acidiphila]|uniref:DUF2189 domain-containing protein n=1 Tax=Methylocapsa acidiphila TaxID=133552 RepID=UPI000427737F|nr:DUF2189 domain-containing protein [Methylocapsa acidiphila]